MPGSSTVVWNLRRELPCLMASAGAPVYLTAMATTWSEAGFWRMSELASSTASMNFFAASGLLFKKAVRALIVRQGMLAEMVGKSTL